MLLSQRCNGGGSMPIDHSLYMVYTLCHTPLVENAMTSTTPIPILTDSAMLGPSLLIPISACARSARLSGHMDVCHTRHISYRSAYHHRQGTKKEMGFFSLAHPDPFFPYTHVAWAWTVVCDQNLQWTVASDIVDHLGELTSPGTIPGELGFDQSLSGKKQFKMQIVSSGWKLEAE